jgi:Zn-dependent protease with chaperone function
VDRNSVLAGALCATLAACASTAPGGRPQLTAPPAISSLYSSVDMDLRLAAAPALPGSRDPDKNFDLQVARIGARLARAAYDDDPTLRRRVPAFSFRVADKSEPGTASDSQGNVAVFRGVLRPGLDDRTLAFLIAREMGHVIARHHEEKSATSLLLSIVVQLVMPFTSLTGGAALLTGSTASLVGSEIIDDRSVAEHSREADIVAFALLKRDGWGERQVAASLTSYARRLGNDAWSQAVRQSAETLVRSKQARTAVSKA